MVVNVIPRSVISNSQKGSVKSSAASDPHHHNHKHHHQHQNHHQHKNHVNQAVTSTTSKTNVVSTDVGQTQTQSHTSHESHSSNVKNLPGPSTTSIKPAISGPPELPNTVKSASSSKSTPSISSSAATSKSTTSSSTAPVPEHSINKKVSSESAKSSASSSPSDHKQAKASSSSESHSDSTKSKIDSNHNVKSVSESSQEAESGTVTGSSSSSSSSSSSPPISDSSPFIPGYGALPDSFYPKQLDSFYSFALHLLGMNEVASATMGVGIGNSNGNRYPLGLNMIGDGGPIGPPPPLPDYEHHHDNLNHHSHHHHHGTSTGQYHFDYDLNTVNESLEMFGSLLMFHLSPFSALFGLVELVLVVIIRFSMCLEAFWAVQVNQRFSPDVQWCVFITMFFLFIAISILITSPYKKHRRFVRRLLTQNFIVESFINFIIFLSATLFWRFLDNDSRIYVKRVMLGKEIEAEYQQLSSHKDRKNWRKRVKRERSKRRAMVRNESDYYRQSEDFVRLENEELRLENDYTISKKKLKSLKYGDLSSSKSNSIMDYEKRIQLFNMAYNSLSDHNSEEAHHILASLGRDLNITRSDADRYLNPDHMEQDQELMNDRIESRRDREYYESHVTVENQNHRNQGVNRPILSREEIEEIAYRKGLKGKGGKGMMRGFKGQGKGKGIKGKSYLEESDAVEPQLSTISTVDKNYGEQPQVKVGEIDEANISLLYHDNDFEPSQSQSESYIDHQNLIVNQTVIDQTAVPISGAISTHSKETQSTNADSTVLNSNNTSKDTVSSMSSMILAPDYISDSHHYSNEISNQHVFNPLSVEYDYHDNIDQNLIPGTTNMMVNNFESNTGPDVEGPSGGPSESTNGNNINSQNHDPSRPRARTRTVSFNTKEKLIQASSTRHSGHKSKKNAVDNESNNNLNDGGPGPNSSWLGHLARKYQPIFASNESNSNSNTKSNGTEPSNNNSSSKMNNKTSGNFARKRTISRPDDGLEDLV